MKVQFVDFSLEPRPEKTFETVDELSAFLRQLKSEEPSAGELIGNNGFKLTVGIDNAIAFAQYSSTDGEPPYLVALTNKPTISECHEFMVTGTPTEVDGKCCLPFEEFEKVVIDFMQTGSRSALVQWEDA